MPAVGGFSQWKIGTIWDPRAVRKFMYIAYSGIVDGENLLKLFAMVVHDRIVESL